MTHLLLDDAGLVNPVRSWYLHYRVDSWKPLRRPFLEAGSAGVADSPFTSMLGANCLSHSRRAYFLTLVLANNYQKIDIKCMACSQLNQAKSILKASHTGEVSGASLMSRDRDQMTILVLCSQRRNLERSTELNRKRQDLSERRALESFKTRPPVLN